MTVHIDDSTVRGTFRSERLNVRRKNKCEYY